MPTNTAHMLKDATGNFIPQYYNPATGQFEQVQGTAGASHAYLGSGAVFNSSGTPCVVQKAFVNASASGNVQLLGAQGAGLKVRVLSVAIVSTSVATVKFQSNVTDITAGFPLSANGGMVLPLNEHGWFETVANDPLNFNLSAASATGCIITYIVTT